MSDTDWKGASRPNYSVNADLRYPYSECPFLGKFNLVKIPESGLVEHVDYWGEGRINDNGYYSGFTDSYNVNVTYKLVSKGANKGRKIPNRIPLADETNCITSSYIKNNSVKIITVMGEKITINSSCAGDIARMVNENEGMVVLYGFNNDQSVKNLENKLKTKGLVYCPGFVLPQKLQGITLFSSHRTFLNVNDYNDQLYHSITSANYDTAVQMCKELKKADRSHVIEVVVDRLLQGDNPKTMTFAYKLWVGDARNIVITCFPVEFQIILRPDNVKIISHYYDQALKLDANMDRYRDRQAWGDSKDKTSARVSWKFIFSEENNRVVFKIKNNEHSMFLKLDVNVDSYHDRLCWGSDNSNEQRHKWTLEPLRFNNKIVFFIVNTQYQQALKLDAHVDRYGDRLLWGTSSNVVSNPNYFGWLVQPWN